MKQGLTVTAFVLFILAVIFWFVEPLRGFCMPLALAGGAAYSGKDLFS